MSRVAVAHEVLQQAEITSAIAECIGGAMSKHVGPDISETGAYSRLGDDVIDGLSRQRLTAL
jgi:hypothetical protein